MRHRSFLSVLPVLSVFLTACAVPPQKAGNLKRLVPSIHELTGFRSTQGPEYYDPDNLWDYINGAAPAFLAYGFQGIVTFSVIDKDTGNEVTADIYDMGNSLNAFGIYSQEKLQDVRPVEFGTDGFQWDTILCFWQDKYYVNLTASAVDRHTAKTLSRLAKTLSKKLPKKGERPRLFSVFPKKGRVIGSERYISRDVLGQKYFTNGYSVEYKQRGSEYYIFLIDGKSAKTTKLNFEKYRSYLNASGETTHKQLQTGGQAFVGKDNYYGAVIAAHEGTAIIVVLGLNNLQTAQNAIEQMLAELL